MSKNELWSPKLIASGSVFVENFTAVIFWLNPVSCHIWRAQAGRFIEDRTISLLVWVTGFRVRTPKRNRVRTICFSKFSFRQSTSEAFDLQPLRCVMFAVRAGVQGDDEVSFPLFVFLTDQPRCHRLLFPR